MGQFRYSHDASRELGPHTMTRDEYDAWVALKGHSPTFAPEHSHNPAENGRVYADATRVNV